MVKGLPYNLAETVMWRATGSMSNFLWDRSTEEGSDKFKGPWDGSLKDNNGSNGCGMVLQGLTEKMGDDQ